MYLTALLWKFFLLGIVFSEFCNVKFASAQSSIREPDRCCYGLTLRIGYGDPIRDNRPLWNVASSADGNTFEDRERYLYSQMLDELSNRMGYETQFVEFNYSDPTRYFPTRYDQSVYAGLANGDFDVGFLWLQAPFTPYSYAGYPVGTFVATPALYTSYFWANILKKSKQSDMFTFLEPFETWLWLAFLGGLVLVAIVLVALRYWHSWSENGTISSLRFRNAFASAAYHVLAAAMTGDDAEWLSGPLRLLRVSMLLLVYVTSAAYTANLAAFFMKQEYEYIGPTNFSELKNARACATNGYVCAGSVDFVSDCIVPDEYPLSFEYLTDRHGSCLKKLENGEVDVIIDTNFLLHQLKLKYCNRLHRVPTIEYFAAHFVLVLRGDTASQELLGDLTKNLVDLIQSPRYPEIINTAFSYDRSCSEEELDEATTLTFESMRGLYICFMGLIFLSLIPLLHHFFKERYNKSSQTRDQKTAAMSVRKIHMGMSDSEKIHILCYQIEHLQKTVAQGLAAAQDQARPQPSVRNLGDAALFLEDVEDDQGATALPGVLPSTAGEKP